MNIIETAFTGFAFGAGTITGIVTGMILSVRLGKEARQKAQDQNDELNRLLRERNTSVGLIAESVGEDTLHDKYIRACLTGLCANPVLVMATREQNPDGTYRSNLELAEESIVWAANRVADAARRENKMCENEMCETLSDALVRLGAEKDGIRHDGDDLTNTGEKK